MMLARRLARPLALALPGAGESWMAGFLAVLLAAGSSALRATPYNNDVLLADAIARGHLSINWPGPYIDALAFNGYHFVIEGPFPAILLLPFVALFGTATNQTALAVVLAGVAVGAAWELCRRYELDQSTTLWLCGFLFAGTDLWWCANFGDVWFIAHVAAVACTMLALVELAGRRRPRLIAVLAVCAAASRFSLVLALPIYAAMLWAGIGHDGDAPPREEDGRSAEHPPDRIAAVKRWLAERQRRGAPALIAFAKTLVPFAIAFVVYNEARWHQPWDMGYTLWYHQDPAGRPTGSPFRLEYLPYQLWSFFLQGPEVRLFYPWLIPSLSGVALTWTSPALVLAFLARRPRPLVVALWAAAAVTALPSFLYYVNGYAQFGMRHALDFEPFLFALMALGVRGRRMPRWGEVLCAISIGVGVWGLWFWKTFIRT